MRTAALAVSLGLVASQVSLGRLWLTQQQFLGNNVFAEDGLFIVCARAFPALDCLLDTYAGYLHAIPRLIVWPVSALPLAKWGFGLNMAAALLAGCVAAAVFLVLCRNRVGLMVSVAVGLIPTLIPIAGGEAINWVAFAYGPVLFGLTIAAAFPIASRFWLIPTSATAALASLTIPSALLALTPLAICLARRRIKPLYAYVVALSGLSGALIQGIAVISSENARPLKTLSKSLADWVLGSMAAWRSLLPGWDPNEAVLQFVGFRSSFAVSIAFALFLLVFAAAALLVLRGEGSRSSAGSLMLVGLLVGLPPMATSTPTSRYFFLTASLTMAGLFLLIDASGVNHWIKGLILAAVLSMWMPSMAASAYRAVSSPPWVLQASEVERECSTSPDTLVSLRFTPDWPWPDTPGLTRFSGGPVRCNLLVG